MRLLSIASITEVQVYTLRCLAYLLHPVTTIVSGAEFFLEPARRRIDSSITEMVKDDPATLQLSSILLL